MLITGFFGFSLSYYLYSHLNLFVDSGKSNGNYLRLNELRLMVMIFKIVQEVHTLFSPSDQPSLSLSFSVTECISLL